MKLFKLLIGALLAVSLSPNLAIGGNPIIEDFGMADPHCYLFEDRLYLFTTRDSVKNTRSLVIPDWHIFTTEDMVAWKHVRTIKPTETYMGE